MTIPTLITYANMGYIVFAKNLLLNLNQRASGYTLHFYCLDNDIKSILERIPLPNIRVIFELLDTLVSRQFERYGSKEYNKITHTKTRVLKDALRRYSFIHFIDCDVVCVKPPAPDYWDLYHDKDIVFQYDAGFYSATRPHWPLHHIWTCTGNTTMRYTSGTQHILDKITEYQERYPTKNDQECLFQYFKDSAVSDITLYPHAKLDTYPYEEFTNGYWINHDIGDLSRTYFFHANHVSGSPAKCGLLKKIDNWYIG